MRHYLGSWIDNCRKLERRCDKPLVKAVIDGETTFYNYILETFPFLENPSVSNLLAAGRYFVPDHEERVGMIITALSDLDLRYHSDIVKYGPSIEYNPWLSVYASDYAVTDWQPESHKQLVRMLRGHIDADEFSRESINLFVQGRRKEALELLGFCTLIAVCCAAFGSSESVYENGGFSAGCFLLGLWGAIRLKNKRYIPYEILARYSQRADIFAREFREEWL